MQLTIFGLTLSSSWGNGHATLWRGLVREELLPVGSRVQDGIERPKAVSEYVVERLMRGGASDGTHRYRLRGAALPDDRLSFLLFPVERPELFDSVTMDASGYREAIRLLSMGPTGSPGRDAMPGTQ